MQLSILIAFIGACCFIHNVSAVSWWEMTPTEVRERINLKIRDVEAPIPSVWAIENRMVQRDSRSTPLRIYLPNPNKGLPVILFIHGGAWVAGSLDTHDNLARYLCSKVEAIVVSVGYMNAPEGKFPLQLHQCLDALTWIVGYINEFSADSSKLAVVGDSAGGNMAAALCLMVRDQQGPKINLQVLINPAPDLTCNGTIVPQNDALDVLRWQAFQYLSDPKDANHPYVSPLQACDLSHLPPAMIILAEKDDLREAGQKYADKLRDACVPTDVYCQQGMNHLAGDGAKASLRASESLDAAVAALQRSFSNNRASLNQSLAEESESLSKKGALTKAANHYVTILNKIGELHSACQSEEILSLCTKNCKKVRNGKLLFEGKELFAAQLNSGKEWLGAWSIDVQEVIISTESRTATIRYQLATEKEDDLMVIVILHFDSNYLIDEINEVHNKLEK